MKRHPRQHRLPHAVQWFAAFCLGALMSCGAMAAPDCDVANPPPICDPQGNAASPKVALTSVARQPAGVVFTGTARDPDAPGAVQVLLKIDGVRVGQVASNPQTGAFTATVPARIGDLLCVTALNRNEGSDRSACKPLAVRLDPIGQLDDVAATPAGIKVRGWSIDQDTADPITVHVYLDGRFATAATASQSRPDVGSAYPPYGSAHGYLVTVPAAKGMHTVCTYGINVAGGSVNTQLGCQNILQGGPPPAPVVTAKVDGISSGLTIGVQVTPGAGDPAPVLVEKARDAAGVWSSFATTDRAVRYADGRIVLDGKNYCYRGTASNAYGSAASAVSCVTVPLPALPRPTGLTLGNVTTTAATLRWTDNAAGEEAYYVNDSVDNTVVLPGTAGTGTMSYTYTTLKPDTKYCFSVAAIAKGHAIDDATSCTRTAPSPVNPPTVQGVKNVSFWNCEGSQRSGSLWQWDYTVGGWTALGAAPSSWQGGSCGPSVSGASIVATLPPGHQVQYVLVVVDGGQCTADDPGTTACRHFETAALPGDPAGVSLSFTVP